MAREHARIFVSIWADDDFRARTAAAQRLYHLLLTQPGLTYAGTTDLRVARWAACAPDTTTADVEAALAELEAHRYVVVDRGTEEVLIRSYLRRDELWKQPKILTLALRQIVTIQSARLRSALRSELLRLPKDDARTEAARTLARTLPDTPWHTPAATPPDTPPETPSGTPARTRPRTPPDTPADTRAEGYRQGARACATRPVASSSSSSVTSPPEPKDQVLSAGESAISPRTEGQRANDLAKRYTDHPDIGGMANFGAVRGITAKAIRTARYTDQAIGDALERLAVAGRSVTLDTLRIELDSRPASRRADEEAPATRLLRRMAAGESTTVVPIRPELETR